MLSNVNLHPTMEREGKAFSGRLRITFCLNDTCCFSKPVDVGWKYFLTGTIWSWMAPLNWRQKLFSFNITGRTLPLILAEFRSWPLAVVPLRTTPGRKAGTEKREGPPALCAHKRMPPDCHAQAQYWKLKTTFLTGQAKQVKGHRYGTVNGEGVSNFRQIL